MFESRIHPSRRCSARKSWARPHLEWLEVRELLTTQLFTAADSAAASVQYLANIMDQYHNRFGVYEDVSSPADHFFAYTKIPDQNAKVAVNGSYTDHVHSGATAILNTFTASTTGESFGGFYFQNGILEGNDLAPRPNFGDHPNAGIDLTGATALTFWVRGEQGGEHVQFFMGGVGRDANTGIPQPGMLYPDSTPVVKISKTLSTQWQKVSIDLAGKDLSYVLGGFGWVASSQDDPNGAVFDLDDIQYELSSDQKAQRLNEPRLLKSYTTLPLQSDPFDANKDDDIDFVLRNTAFLYDNAVALMAFLAEGSGDSVRRAKLIGDALVYDSKHDRTYTDGRLRTDYAAGDLTLPPGWSPHGQIGAPPTPGFYSDAKMQFFEIEQQSIDTGNNAWAMIALLALYRRTGTSAYLDTARRIGDFIHTLRSDSGTYQGFLGGINDPESANPQLRAYASTEHNLDVYAAFSTMFKITGESRWQDDAQHARKFVLAMWDASRNCYVAGTLDSNTRNELPSQLPLDVQEWNVLALPDSLTLHPELLSVVEQNFHTNADGVSGYDFNNDRDAVWFEGTAQTAVAYATAFQPAQAELIRQELRRAQQTTPFGDGAGIAAASHDGLTTGFDFKYFRRLHIAATGWNVFAQLGFNPFYQFAIPVEPTDSARFAAGVFHDLLGRPIDPASLGYFQIGLDSARQHALGQLISNFTTSDEYRLNLVAAYYVSYLGRDTRPPNSEINGWLQSLRQGATEEQVISSIVASPEAFQNQGNDNARWLDHLYTIALGRGTPRDPGAQILLEALNRGVPRKLISDTIVSSSEFVRYVIQNTYAFYLGRRAGTDEVAIWLSGLGTPPAGQAAASPDEQFIGAVLASEEYFQKTGNTDRTWIISLYTMALGRALVDPNGEEVANALASFLGSYAHGRSSFATDVVTSTEFRETLVERYYRSFLRRAGSKAEIDSWAAKLQDGETDEQVLAGLVGSDEYFLKSELGGGDNAKWLNQVYLDLLARNSSGDPGAQAFLDALNQGRVTRLIVTDAILMSSEYGRSHVQTLYSTYLNRSNPTGGDIDFWFQQFHQGLTDEQITVGFLVSTEYSLLPHLYP